MNVKNGLFVIAVVLFQCLTCKAQSNAPVETFPASMATNDPFDFILRPDGKYIWNPDLDRFWRLGVWKEMTNDWRVLLFVSTNTSDISGIAAGSKVVDSGLGYYTAPYGKVAKFELRDSSGKVVQPKPNAGTNMLKGYDDDLVNQTNLPAWASPTNGSLEVDFPEITTGSVFPRKHLLSGAFAGRFMFRARMGPMPISTFVLGDLYPITNEGDYTLTVQPVLYKYQLPSPLNDKTMFHRVDLPAVTTKVHLKPSQ
jgi:hypothetical protein